MFTDIDVKIEVDEREANIENEGGKAHIVVSNNDAKIDKKGFVVEEDLAVPSSSGMCMGLDQARPDLNNLTCSLVKLTEFTSLNKTLLHVPNFAEDNDFFLKKYNSLKQQDKLTLCPTEPLIDQDIKRSNEYITFGLFKVYRDDIYQCIERLLEVINAIDLVKAIGFDPNNPKFWPKVNVEEHIRDTIRTLISLNQDQYELSALQAQANKGNVFVESKKNYESICAAKERRSRKVVPQVSDLAMAKETLPNEVKTSVMELLMQRPRNLTSELLNKYDSSLLNGELEMALKDLPPHTLTIPKPTVVTAIASKREVHGKKVSPFYNINEYEKLRESDSEPSYHCYEEIDLNSVVNDYSGVESSPETTMKNIHLKDLPVNDSASEENEELAEINKAVVERTYQNVPLSTFTDNPPKTLEKMVNLDSMHEKEQNKFLDSSKSPYMFPKCMTPMSDRQNCASYAASVNSSNTYESIEDVLSEEEIRFCEQASSPTESNSNTVEIHDDEISGTQNTNDLEIPATGQKFPPLVQHNLTEQNDENETSQEKCEARGIKRLVNYLSCNLLYKSNHTYQNSSRKVDPNEDLLLSDEILYYGFQKRDEIKRTRDTGTQCEVWLEAQSDQNLLKQFRELCSAPKSQKQKVKGNNSLTVLIPLSFYCF